MTQEKLLDDFKVNDTYSFCRTYSLQDFEAFSQLSGDENPLHHDEVYAAQTSFAQPIVPLHLAASPLSAIAGMVFPGHKSLYLSHQLKAINPVPYDVELTYSAKLTAIDKVNRILTIRTVVFHERQLFIEAEQKIQIRDDVKQIDNISTLHHAGSFVQPNQAILITGAAGELGQCVAQAFAKQSYNLVLQVRKQSNVVEDFAKQLQERYEIEVDIMACDLTDSSIDKFTNLLERLSLKPGCVIHCASPSLCSDLPNLMSVNYSALKNLSDALLPSWFEQQHGSLIFVSSSATHFHPEGWQDYCAAKTAGINFCASFNHRFQSMGLSAKVISPGLIATRFSADLDVDQSKAMLPEQVAEAIVELHQSEQSFYTWVEPSMTQMGNYGFFAKQHTIQTGNPQVDRSQKSIQSVEITQQNVSNVGVSLEQALQNVIVERLGLPPQTDWLSAGVAVTPKWDSLNHMLLLVEIERQFGVSVASAEMDRTSTYQQLLSLLMEKLSD